MISELRKFGITLGVVFGLLALVFWLRGRACFLYIFILSALFLICALCAPRLLKHVHKVWMTFGMSVGWVMTRVILSILFYLVVTPTGLIARLFGKDFLDIKYDKNAKSHWIPKGSKAPLQGPQGRGSATSSYENQY